MSRASEIERVRALALSTARRLLLGAIALVGLAISAIERSPFLALFAMFLAGCCFASNRWAMHAVDHWTNVLQRLARWPNQFNAEDNEP